MEPGALNGQHLLDDESARGQAPRRSITSGELLTPTLLQAPVLVHHGDPAMMQLKNANFIIHADGRATGSDHAG